MIKNPEEGSFVLEKHFCEWQKSKPQKDVLLGKNLAVQSYTKRERLKSALYLRLKKRKDFKIVKGYPLGILKSQLSARKIEGD